MTGNPYSNAAPHQMWRRSVSRIEPHLMDPVVSTKFLVQSDARVATAGSCFAQHIARKIASMDFNYFVPENGAHLDDTERLARQYGVFSGRYGNIYTVAQLLQLFEEVFEGRQRTERAWLRADGRYVDPYRPQVEPDGYTSAQEVIEERVKHLAAVKRVFLESNIFIFTLGLTEAWRSKIDGSVFPVAPGVSGSQFDSGIHEFHNYTAAEVQADLLTFLDKLKTVNPGVSVLLTVSPVPLIATYEQRHVIVSTVYSKSVLRVAAQAAADAHQWVDYFPSFEIMTSGSTAGRYFEDDYREVSSAGVAHAMRCFVSHYVKGKPLSDAAIQASYRPHGYGGDGIICDEEAIDQIR